MSKTESGCEAGASRASKLQGSSAPAVLCQGKADSTSALRRYVSLMKKSSEAGATLRDGAADLWRKGVAMSWHVPADSGGAPTGVHSTHPHAVGSFPWAGWRFLSHCGIVSVPPASHVPVDVLAGKG